MEARQLQESSDDSRTHRIRQVIKWTVYALLIVNFVFYILEDWNRSIHTIDAGSTLLDWASEFATSIDETAWFLLLVMFELETYVLSDESLKGWLFHAVRGIRLLSYGLIAHTIYAFVVTVINLQPTVQVAGVSDLCALVDAKVSYVYNLEYTAINEETCSGLPRSSAYFQVADNPVVSNLEGLNLERDLALADLAEAIVWLLILVAIELVVRLQSLGISSGRLITIGNSIKTLLYLTLIALGVYWATLSHWLYLWDELVWIGGFAAIEMNLRDWRDELIEENEASLTAVSDHLEQHE